MCCTLYPGILTFWYPKGERIGFLSRRDGRPAQLYIIKPGWSEAKRVTALPVDVYAPQWFPGGERIAFAANIHPDYKGDFDKLQRIIRNQQESKVTAKVTENVMYRFWDRWFTDGFFPRLFFVELQSGEITDLMPETSNYFHMRGGVSYDISADGEEIAVSMNSIPEPFEKFNYDIFLLKTDGSGDMENITEDNPADDLNPVYSPDGNQILYGKQNIPHFYADRVEMVVYERSSGNRRNITSHIDLSCEQWQWSADGRTIFFHARHEAKRSIFSISAKGGNHTKIFDRGNNSNLKPIENRLIFTHNNYNMPSEIYSIEDRGGNLKQLTAVNKDMLDKLRFGKIENVTYKGANDADIQMYIIYPPDFDPNKKYPLAMRIHGGPHSAATDAWSHRWNAHLLAEPGYVVAMPNFHGSISF